MRPSTLLVAILSTVSFVAPTRSGAAPEAKKDEASAASVSFSITPLPRKSAPAKIAPAKHYAKAKRLLARGSAQGALKELAKERSDILLDRVALLRGDALLALGQSGKAEASYLTAFEKAQVIDVKYRAAKGLISVYKLIGNHKEQLKYLTPLLEVRNLLGRPNLVLDQAMALEQVGKKAEAAEIAWRLMLDYPTSKASGRAERLLEQLKLEGIKIPVSSDRVELARIRNLWRSGSYTRAERALSRLEKKSPRLKDRIDLERVDILKKRGRKGEELKLLSELYKRGIKSASGARVLERLGKLAMGQDQNEKAIEYFDELKERYPTSNRAAEGQFLAAWLPYNDGDYESATKRFFEFVDDFKSWSKRPEGLWFAAWSAYLGGKDTEAMSALDRILVEHPESSMGLYSYYWKGRILEKQGKKDEARNEYREVLKTAPLSYHAHWAIERLEGLGETVVFNAGKPERPASVKKVLQMLGSDRPLTVDRAVALHGAGLSDEAQEELDAAESALASIKNTRGRVMVAEMLNALGDYYAAFKMAVGITNDGADLITGKPYAWRAWRLAYPKAFWKEVKAAAKEHDIDPLLVLSIMRTESHFRPWVKSPVGARGLMQLMPKTAEAIGRKARGGRPHAARYTQAASNIWLGTWYLKSLLNRYDGQMACAAGAYNAGPIAVDKWLDRNGGRDLDEWVEAISYRETRRYVRRVLETYLIYRRLEGLKMPDLSGPVRVTKIEKHHVNF